MGRYTSARGSSARLAWCTSPTTPTTSRNGSPSSVSRARWPNAEPFERKRRAKVSLTTITGAAPAPSVAFTSRPSFSGMRSVAK
ncbi:hypothetical protein COEX109129_42565 [Corallococcus exiguus]